MEKIECKSCSAVVDKELEFCSSCGDWLGLSLKDMENKDSNKSEKIERTKTAPEQLLNKPLSTYGATPLPSRKEVPGMRAVFFLTVLIPAIALASYLYNSNIAEEVVEETKIIQQSTTSTTSTSVVSVLQKQYPISCSASSSYNNGDGWSCENLYDGDKSTWQDNSLACEDGWIEFNFAKELYIEFLVFQNVEDSKSFTRNHKVRDILITTSDSQFSLDKELENDNTSQWIDVNATTSYLKIDILSAYPGEEISGSQPFEECAIQEITFYGRG
jgi:hypothetical protein